MDDCLFCTMYSKKQGVIYESDSFYARFDDFPAAPGHTEVIPKRHVVSLFDLTREEWEDMQNALLDVRDIIEETNFVDLYQKCIDSSSNDKAVDYSHQMLDHIGIHEKAESYTIGVNEGEAAGRTVHHLHVHLIPRFFGDVEDYVGGIRHVIPEKGDYIKDD